LQSIPDEIGYMTLKAEILFKMGELALATKTMGSMSVPYKTLSKFDRESEIYRLRVVAEICNKQNDIHKSLKYLEEGGILAREGGYVFELIRILLLYAEVFIRQGRTEEATAFIYEAEKRIADYESPDHAFDLIDLRKRLAATKAFLTAHDTSAENTDPPAPPGAPA
jgi:hypothetical protein